MTQAELFHDNPIDALRSTVEALGGAKRVGAMVWPALPIVEAQRRMLKVLDPERAEKLSLDELFHIWRAARDRGIHILTEYVGYSMHYEVRPIQPEERKAELVDRVAALLAQAAQLTKQLEGIK